MTQQDFSLAKVFSDLATDPRWPEQLMKLADQITGDILIESKILRQLKLTMARLALRLVDEIACNLESDELAALQTEDINPDDYANVKERVEEAET